ncbi:hypothetical protein HK099_002316, partial [Clydaea vesicula]
MFSMIIVLETVIPSLAEGLEKASQQGMPNPVNSQSTYVSLTSTSYSANDQNYDVKVLKQRIMVDSVSYLLQEIYGFLDDANESGTTDPVAEAESRDCVICMCEARNTIVLPCRHLCLCNECADVLRAQGRNVPPEANVGVNAATNSSEGNLTNVESPAVESNLNSAPEPAVLNNGLLGGFQPSPPSRILMGPPKCPICRQVFHSLLQINLPKPAAPQLE